MESPRLNEKAVRLFALTRMNVVERVPMKNVVVLILIGAGLSTVGEVLMRCGYPWPARGLAVLALVALTRVFFEVF